MKMRIIFAMKRTILAGLIVCGSAHAITYDTGKVLEVYTQYDGMMAVKLEGGVPNANAVNSCGHTSANGPQWAGVESSAHDSIRSALLAAKTTDTSVNLVVNGECMGTKVKIFAVYTL